MNKISTEKLTGAAAEAPIVKKARRVAGNKGLLRTILMLIVPAILVIGGGYYWLTSGGSVSTDDAQVKQDIVSVSAQVNGPIVQAFVRNGSQVKRGDLLFRIDPAPYRVALEQAMAQLAGAKLQTTQLQTTAAGTGADIVGEQANLEIKRNALARQQALLKQGFTTRADYEDALERSAHGREGPCRRARSRGECACGARARRTAADRAGTSGCGQGQARPVAHRSPRADGRRGRECRQPADRPDGRDRAWDAFARPQPGAVGRGELQGEGRRADGSGPEGDHQGRCLPGREVRGACPEHRHGHRKPVFAAAGAERQRQLGQGDPARAGADRVRRHSVQADDRRPVGDRNGRIRQEDSREWPARRASPPIRFRPGSG